ncbi:MAG: hypothetical protein EBQ80_03530 [Proteobacteria bacterium]|nr:hypothetical protein [Pseudomonadota bacterium]
MAAGVVHGAYERCFFQLVATKIAFGDGLDGGGTVGVGVFTGSEGVVAGMDGIGIVGFGISWLRY